MVEQELTKAIVEIAKSEGVDPGNFTVREATSCGATKAGMPRMMKHLAGQTAFLYSLSRDAELITWLIEQGWSRRPFDNGDLFWKGC